MLPVFNCKDRVPIPAVICGNKVDCIERKVKPPHITYHREKGLQYYDFSVRTLYNFQKPLLFLARRALGELELVSTSNIGVTELRELTSAKHVGVCEGAGCGRSNGAGETWGTGSLVLL
jgi:GTP-binding nuclear protein Ran